MSQTFLTKPSFVRFNILVVDDDSTSLSIVSAILKFWDYDGIFDQNLILLYHHISCLLIIYIHADFTKHFACTNHLLCYILPFWLSSIRFINNVLTFWFLFSSKCNFFFLLHLIILLFHLTILLHARKVLEAFFFVISITSHHAVEAVMIRVVQKSMIYLSFYDP